MTRSMTGYAHKRGSSPLGDFFIEIHSVNRKGLDLSISLPKELLCFDIDLRKWLVASLERGQVSLRLILAAPLILSSEEDVSVLRQSKEGWETLCQKLSWDPSQITLPFLLSNTPQAFHISSSQEKEMRTSLQKTVQEALFDLINMKEREGNVLAQDLQKRRNAFETHLAAIEAVRQVPVSLYEKKMQEKFESLHLLDEEGKTRLMKEVALLAEKLDISEEIVRLRSHLHQFKETLGSCLIGKGRVLDFMVQEMLRETNTIGSKVPAKEVASSVIQMKSELEKMREQVQNIE